MAKILLVEDDSNLREIYGARLEAEGYDISSANDGEEALAIAVREKPDLIITDVMMPKISGFDMLDILRSTPETRDVKIIMMTALSQDEDRQRGTDLGADHYIVKSQVTLDDVIGIVKDVLSGGTGAAPTAQQATPTDDTTTAATPPPTQTPADINDEVQQFVASSPLMNGTPPTATPTDQPTEEPTESEPPQQPMV